MYVVVAGNCGLLNGLMMMIMKKMIDGETFFNHNSDNYIYGENVLVIESFSGNHSVNDQPE